MDITREMIESGELFEVIKKEAPMHLSQPNINEQTKHYSVLAIRLPDSRVVYGYFTPTDTLKDVYDFLETFGIDRKKHLLTTPEPRRAFTREDYFNSIEQLQLSPTGAICLAEPR